MNEFPQEEETVWKLKNEKKKMVTWIGSGSGDQKKQQQL